MAMGEISVVEDHGLYASSCGYCKSNGRTGVAYGLSAYSLTVDDYQDLLDRGWRRSGTFLYKPEMEKTCCPAYTIRLKADSFTASKEQARVLRRMQRYLDGIYNGPRTVGEHQKESNVVPERVGRLRCEHPSISNRTQDISQTALDNGEASGFSAATKSKDKGKLLETDEVARDISSAIEAAIRSCITSGELPAGIDYPEILVQRAKLNLKRHLKNLDGDLEYTTNAAFLIAARSKHMHVHNWPKNIASESDKETETHKDCMQETSTIILSELLASKIKNHDCLHGLKVQACKGHLNFTSVKCVSEGGQNHADASCCNNTSKVGQKIWAPLDVDEGPNLSTRNANVSMPQTHKLDIRMRRSTFDLEEFALYKKYQIAVHNDKPEDVTEISYRRFLVESPLIFIPPSNSSTPPCGFGSFHQQYFIDGQLVAVGVMDILPSCLSSKYLFWDPDLPFLSLGKYSALQEITWVQDSHKYCPTLQYYYLGYYIHSCTRMRYKAAYSPSELLCPVRYQWVPIRIARPLLDKQSYICLSDYIGETTLLDMSTDSKNTKEKLAVHVHADSSGESEMRDLELVEMESPMQRELIQSFEVASSSKESEDVGNILLKLRGQYLRFKHLEALRVVHTDALVNHLRKYLQFVGSALAARIAYAVG